MSADRFDQQSWQERWADAIRVHGERLSQRPPSSDLMDAASSRASGRALDAGCGHGAETAWLAERGWKVTAVDFAATALDVARARVGEDADVEFVEADLGTWTPPARAFDLVLSLHVHIAGSVEEFVARMASAVAPGGTLLLTGYQADHPDGAQTQVSVNDAIGASPRERWEIARAQTRQRTTPTRGMDAVVCARRRT